MNIISCGLSLGVVLVIAGCSTKKTTGQPSAQPVDTVQVFALQKGLVVKTISLPAELIPWERAELVAKISGYVRAVNVDIGDNVKKDQVLAVLDAPEVAANFGQSSAGLQAAGARYHSSLDTYKRILQASGEKGVISESELEKARNQMLSDSSALEAAKAGASATAQLRNYLMIRAPFDGVITQRQADAGALVSIGSKSLLVIENINKLKLRVAVPENYSASLNTSDVIFTVSAIPGKVFKAAYSRRSNQIDAATRTEQWEFEFLNKPAILKSGMFANAVLKLQRTEFSFTVPFSAVVTNLERNFVIRIRDGKAEWVDVKNGMSLTDKIEIFGPLEEGDLLVLKANDEIKPAVEVAVKKVPATP